VIELRGVAARAGAFSLRDVTFTVPQGCYGIVIGAAGAGKTTLLETIAGLIPAQAGAIVLGGEEVTRLPPERRRLSLVYQHAFLFPHLSVAQNVEYGAPDHDTAASVAEQFGLAGLRERSVRELSGGERQLVALARALAHRPEVLLLDEPFAALDPRTRAAARRALRAVYYERRFTVLQVTHDFSEAGVLGDVAVLLDAGRVLQTGTPEELFQRPASPYIADFVGAENVLAGTARPIGPSAPDFTAAANSFQEQNAVAFTTGAITLYALGDVVAGAAHAVIRAEEIALSVSPATSSIRNQFPGTVVEIAPAGAITRVTVDVSGTRLVAAVTTRSARELSLAPGSSVVAGFKATAVHLC
jgi:molybdopterin-binding protein